MSRFSKLIEDLENSHEQDIKNSAKAFAITATLSSHLQKILQDLETSKKALPKSKLTQVELIKRYGSYPRAYAAYQQAYGIKCKWGWKHFLKAIDGLYPPVSLEDRIEKLEATVKLLVEILLEN
ncbi:hypothetical protein [Crocosphaera sp. XPORK-15E]|uniref:hypothetical protein n=1 Tax=Crocosphaera sp. XPORK-15E TaxID=3110247 RepID=UPI002B212E84|nr:hypothetical protein [Crocosphaera sp. XPORK-15E]MEA5535298.1 hypothetical protein [Crocosphaera sp. XPORK-15E]